MPFDAGASYPKGEDAPWYPSGAAASMPPAGEAVIAVA